MQNSNPFPDSLFVPPLSFDEALARAYERARARLRTSESPLAACGDEPVDDAAQRRRDATLRAPIDPNSAPRAARCARVTIDELLPVFREPLEWVLARAEQHAHGDAIDLAAIERVRAAYQHHLARSGSGGLLGDARPRLRPTDLLIVAGLVIGSIDPSFVQRTSAELCDSLFEALAQAIPLGAAGPLHAVAGSSPTSPMCWRDQLADAMAFGPPSISRLVVPLCCCRHGHVL